MKTASAIATGVESETPEPDADEVAGPSVTLVSEPSSGQPPPSLDFEHQILKIVRAHTDRSLLLPRSRRVAQPWGQSYTQLSYPGSAVLVITEELRPGSRVCHWKSCHGVDDPSSNAMPSSEPV